MNNEFLNTKERVIEEVKHYYTCSNGATNIVNSLSGEDYEEICSMFVDGIDLIDIVHDEVREMKRQVKNPRNYVISYGNRVGWTRA